MRKTRKFPNIFGSIRKRKKDLKQAKGLDRWYRMAFKRNSCVSEPICLESLIP